MNTRIGLQLYSIRQAMETDFIGSLEKVKAAGYDCVEFAGYGGFSAGDLKRELQRIGLEPYSSHVGWKMLAEQLDEVVAYSVELGLSWVICPGYPLNDAKDVGDLAELLATAAKALNPRGIKVGYHNHHKEFQKIGDRYMLDMIPENKAGMVIYTELDTCWAQYADVDPVAYFKTLGAKAGPIHCKDINANYQGMAGHDINVEVGNGIVDYAALIAVARQNGTLDHGLIVEQEAFTRDMFESIRISCDNLKKLLQ